MPLSRYASSDLARFLTAIDGLLPAPAKLVVIGGGALALGYGGTAATSDIDTFESPLDAIAEAVAMARTATGLDIPIANSTIAQLPPGYEARLVRVLPELETLEVDVLEAHDLAASKLVRGNEHDRQQLAQLHALSPLDLATLLDRFQDLMSAYVGEPSEPWWSLRHFVEEIWGDLAAIAVDDLRSAR